MDLGHEDLLQIFDYLHKYHLSLKKIADELAERNRVERLRNNIYDENTPVMIVPPGGDPEGYKNMALGPLPPDIDRTKTLIDTDWTENQKREFEAWKEQFRGKKNIDPLDVGEFSV